MDKDREQFEAWIKEQYPSASLEREESGLYLSGLIQGAWEGWQKRGQPLLELLLECPFEPSEAVSDWPRGYRIKKGKYFRDMTEWLTRVAEITGKE